MGIVNFKNLPADRRGLGCRCRITQLAPDFLCGDVYGDDTVGFCGRCQIEHEVKQTSPHEEPTVDMVNHPPHYTQHPSGVECIRITRHMSFTLGNALKYIWRADLKGKSIEDLEKAEFYLKQEIALRKENAENAK